MSSTNGSLSITYISIHLFRQLIKRSVPPGYVWVVM